jgi:predicted ATPase
MPRPPELMVLNEPETRLHPDIISSLARLILYATEHSQMWIVSHSDILTQWLEDHGQCNSFGKVPRPDADTFARTLRYSCVALASLSVVTRVVSLSWFLHFP